MNLPSVAFTGATALVVGSTYHLRTPSNVNRRAVFRRVFGLRIATGGLADEIRFGASAHFAFTLQDDDFDIRSSLPSDALAQSGSNGIAVTLPVPLLVRGARFAGGAATSSAVVELYRMDGDKIAKDATKSAANTSGATFGGAFTDLRFGVKLTKADGSAIAVTPGNLTTLNVRGRPTAPRIGLAPAHVDAAEPFFFWNPGGIAGQPDGPPASNDIGDALAQALQQHVDALDRPFDDPIDIQLVIESDAPFALAVTSFAIPVSLVRTHFRSVLFRREDVGAANDFATRLREHSTPLSSYLRAKLATPTRQAVDRLNGGAVPERVATAITRDLDAAIQAEAIYTAQRFQGIALSAETLAAAQAAPTGVKRTRVNRALLEEAFPDELQPIPEPDSDEKVVLEAKGANTREVVLVDLPRTAVIATATLRIEGDLQGDAPSTGAPGGTGGGTGGADDWDEPIPDTTGIAADATRAVALRITPADAIDTSGVALALSAISAAAELTAEIREDEDGAPAGRILAAGKSAIERLDAPAWTHFAFRTPVVLESRAFWIVLRATSGSALWLASASAGTTRVGDNIAKGWNDRGGFDDIAPMHQLWARGGPGGAPAKQPGLPAADKGIAGRLRVTIGSSVVVPSPLGKDRACAANIAAALQSWLAAQPAGPAVVVAPIVVVALGKGKVTIHPPEITYGF